MNKKLRLIILLSAFILGGLALYPTFEWYFLTSSEQKSMSAGSRLEVRKIATAQAEEATEKFVGMLNGTTLDLYKDGMPKSEEGLIHLKKEAGTLLKQQGKKLSDTSTVKDIAAAFESRNQVYYILLDFYRERIQKIKNRKNKIVNLGLDLSGGVSAVLQVDLDDLETKLEHSPNEQEKTDAINRAMFVLQNRIDRFGVSEPRIRPQGNDSIRIEIPGDNDRERINSFLQGKGTMSFKIVHTEATQALLDIQSSNPSWIYTPDDVPDFIPAGTEVMEYVERDEFLIDQHRRWIVVYQDVDSYGIDGVHLREAQVSNDPLTNNPVVNFQLDQEGAQKFAKLTNEYLNESLAILLDGKVRAYATISSVINDGQASIRGFDYNQASDISTILQTSALPVKLDVVNQQVVGPTLGQQVIQSGLRAIIVGFVLVIVFTILYYKGAGLISVFSLLCNLYFLISLLSAFNFTLTLTSIAGIILTVGMAVDANVLVFERIKEELALGKTRRTAIQTGFRRAFWSIVDANLTTFIAAFFISQIASGPVQGFAVTLSIGIVTTLFSALFISRLLFDFGTDVLRLKRVSISWRKLS